MSPDMNSSDLLAFFVVFGIVVLVVLIIDFVIFCYWLSFKYKEYSYQQAYGPVIKFPPRDAGSLAPYIQSTETPLVEPYTGYTPALPPDQLSTDVPVPNTEYPIPNTEYPTPNTESSLSESVFSFSPPQFDFLPSGATREAPIASVLQTELSSESENESEPAAEPVALDLNNGDVEESAIDQPVVTADPLEDTRPIDATVVGAFGGLRSPFAATWSLTHPFVGIQVILTVVTIVSTILLLPKMLTAGSNAMTTPYGLAVVIFSLFIQNVGFVSLTAYLVKGYGTSLSRIGLRAPTLREVGLGLALGVCVCFAAVLMEKGLYAGASHLFSKQFVDRMGKLSEGLSAGGTFDQIHSVPFQIWFIIAGAIAAPIGEEVFFRGLLYNSLKKRWGIPAGVILSGICFGLIHFAPIAVIIIIPMGCLLAIVYERTKSLWVTILMHAVNNGAQLIVAMYTMNHPAGH